jgi:hypothetical protein
MGQPAEQLLHVLTNGDDKDRAYTVADLLFQFETYVLNGSMSALGLMGKHPEAARDLFAHKTMLDELAAWARSVYGPLYVHSGVDLPTHDPLKRAPTVTEEAPVIH